jgi:hypothetical protein
MKKFKFLVLMLLLAQCSDRQTECESEVTPPEKEIVKALKFAVDEEKITELRGQELRQELGNAFYWYCLSGDESNVPTHR